MAYNYTCKRFIQRKMGVHGHFFFKAFKWIKPEDSENLTKIPKHDKQTSLKHSNDLNLCNENNILTISFLFC